MIHIRLPQSEAPRHLPFYLAMEQWVAKSLPAGEYFFTWSVRPTVICGRHQDPAAEADLDFCREKGIEVYRRRSGGGCVYSDSGNLMLSHITDSDDVLPTFARYLKMIAGVLQKAGIDAQPNDHNDVQVGERKVSGNAYQRLPGRSIVHGTMLYTVDIETMLRALTPSREKLDSHRVASVAARVVAVSDLTDRFADIKALSDFAISNLTDSELLLTDSQVDEIAALAPIAAETIL